MSSNSNARRCFTEDALVLDPCFIAPVGHHDEALYVSDPTNRAAIKLTVTVHRTEHLTEGLTEGHNAPRQLWFIELNVECAIIVVRGAGLEALVLDPGAVKPLGVCRCTATAAPFILVTTVHQRGEDRRPVRHLSKDSAPGFAGSGDG